MTESDVLVTKKVENYTNDGMVITTNFTYNGKKIVGTTDSDGDYEHYTYAGDLLTNIKYYDSDDVLQEEETFTYNGNGDLVSYLMIESVGDHGQKEDYVHNSDGTISVTSYYGTAASQPNMASTGVIYFVNGEVSKIETTTAGFDDSTTLYTYDTKNNPYKNITGYAKIAFVDFDANGCNHNILTSNTAGTSSNESYTTVYTYNALNFPLTDVETDNSDGTTISTQYTYN